MKQAICRADLLPPTPPQPASADLFRVSISVQHEAGEGAVFVVVAPVRLPAVQFDVNLVPGLEVEDNTVAGVVVVLVGVLGDGTGSHLEGKFDISADVVFLKVEPRTVTAYLSC